MRSKAPPRRGRRAPPVFLLIPAAAGLALFALPVIGLAARTPWRRLPSMLAEEMVADALRISLVSSLSACALSLALGVPWLGGWGCFTQFCTD